MPIEKKEAALEKLIEAGAKLEMIATGFGCTEGVTWVDAGRTLFISTRTSLYKIRTKIAGLK